MDYQPDGSHFNTQMLQLSTSVCEERGLWDVTSSDLFNANLHWHTAPYWSAITGCLWSVFTIIRQTFRILSQIITAICLCWGLDWGLMHIWIWWHSLDGETCLISFQHATYLPQGRERYPISTDQYFQHADVCTSLLLEQNPCDPQNSRIIPFRDRLMLAECLHFSICLFFVGNIFIDMFPGWHMVTCMSH